MFYLSLFLFASAMAFIGRAATRDLARVADTAEPAGPGPAVPAEVTT